MSILRQLIADADDQELAELAARLEPFREREEPLLTPDAAAKQLGVHTKTLTRAAAAGRVAGAIRVGARWRFRSSELELRPVRKPTSTPPPPAQPRTGSIQGTTAGAIRGGQTNRRTA
jgi:excisionase family DNA binding protein